MEFSAENKLTAKSIPTVSVKIISAPKDLENRSEAKIEFLGEVSDGSAISRYECEIDGSIASDCNPKTVLFALADGVHKFNVKAYTKDAESNPASHSWVIDTVAPVVQITSAPKPITNLNAASFAYLANDASGSGIDSIKCRIDSAQFQSCEQSNIKEYTNLADGKRNFVIQAVDKAGNVSAPVSMDWLIDTIAPTVTFATPVDKVTKNSKLKFPVLAKDDGGSGVDFLKCTIDTDAEKNCTSEDTFEFKEGTHKYSVIAYDKAGNKSLSLTHDFLVDTLAPKVTLVEYPKNPTNNKSARFVFTANDETGSGIAKYSCKLDAGSYADCVSPVEYKDLGDGEHTFQVKAVDVAGNESVDASWKWTIDTVLPVVAFVTSPKNPTTEKSASFTYTITETGSGLEKFYCKLDGIDYLCPVLGAVALLNLPVGPHSLSVYAKDFADNTGVATYNWNVEELAPKCYEDLYIQPDFEITKKIDILFITDSSGSLDDEKAGIVAGIGKFISQLPADVDFQIAVTLGHGSSSIHSGKLYQSSNNEGYVLSKSLGIPAIQQKLGYKLQNQPSDNYSDGGEEGLYSLSNLISDQKFSVAQSQGFFRNDAALAVIFVADENDICAVYPAGVVPVPDPQKSEDAAKAKDCGGITVDGLYAKLKQRKADLPLVVAGMIYTNPLTVPKVGENEVGYGYTDLISISKGLAVDLASSDYAKGLESIGATVTKRLNLLTDFKLKYDNIDQNSIVVKVDGNVVKHTYVSLANEVKIDVAVAGTAKSKISVYYCESLPISLTKAN